MLILMLTNKLYFYNLLIKTRLKNKRTNLGNIYLENTYIIVTNKTNAKITWLIK
jgi:hypothetical protein